MKFKIAMFICRLLWFKSIINVEWLILVKKYKVPFAVDFRSCVADININDCYLVEYHSDEFTKKVENYISELSKEFNDKKTLTT